ncbi:MAG: polysaccharide pyruvyl transferase CsaB, partial [Clostridiales bacterium]|nr:polysaccharide pyruvyl transferase CsaB [Clostridiales bacterium]
IIVGDGDDSESVFRAARKKNEEAGIEYINPVGRRTDVNQFLLIGYIFVGISRAALEAMSIGLPVILAGAPGYIGIFDESKLQIGISTNFTCRSCAEVDTALLVKDMSQLLNFPPSKLKKMGAYCRSVVEEYYSVDRMCRDALMLYETIRYPDKKIHAVISGYYGYNNNGDDTVLKAVIEGLRAKLPNAEITVLSMRPRQTSAIYNVNSINRFNVIAVRRALKNAKLLLTGGGSLIQDITSTQSLVYYLWLINWAHNFGTRNMLFANGIGPVKKPSNISRVKKTLNQVDLITLRDELSMQTLTRFGVTSPKIVVTADAAFSLGAINQSEVNNLIRELDLTGKKFFGIAVRRWRYNMPNFEDEIAKFCDYISNKYHYTALFLPMRPVDDTEISKRIMNLMKQPSVFLGERYTTDQIRGVVGMSEFVLGMRLHTLIYAALTGTPVIGLVYDSKVKAMMEALNQNYYRLVEDFHWEELRSYADKILSNRQAVIKQILEAGYRETEKAEQNTRLCLELMNKKLF